MENLKKNISWPLGITLVFVLFFIFLFGFLVYSRIHKVDLVTRDYYKREIAYQEQIDRVERTKALSESITIKYDEISQKITLIFPSQIKPSNISGNILFFRPSDAKQDEVKSIELSEERQQTIDVKHLSKGMWRMKIFWQFDGDEYYEEKIIIIK